MPYISSRGRYLRKSTQLLLQAMACLPLLTQAQLPAHAAGPAAAKNNAATSPAQSQPKVNAREIAAKIVAAYGGPDRVNDLKNLSYKSHGTHSVISALSGASNSLVCEIIGHGDKLRLETKLIGQPMILGYNGKDSWTQFGDWVNPSTETTIKRISEEMKHGLNLLADILDPRRRLDYLGSKPVQGKTCDVLQVYADDGKPTTFYADSTSHLVLRTEYMGVDHEQGVPALHAVEYLDYKPAAGTFSPFHTVEFTGSKKTSETVLDNFELGVNVDDKIFEMPPESEVARVKEGVVTIPFDFVANEIMIKVRINSTDYSFIVDTGASQTVIDKAIASTLGTVSQGDYSITAGSKAVPLNYMTISSLTMGDVTLNNIPALITDLSSFQAVVGQRQAGLIGANILRRFLVTFDFLDKKIVLSDPHKVTVPPGATVIKTSPVYGATALVIPGKLDNKLDLNFLVDTGAGFNNLPQAAVKSLVSGPVLPVGQIFGVDGKKMSIGSVRLKSLKLGTLELPEPVFALSPQGAASGGTSGLFTAGSMGILGNPVWSQFRTTIDYRNERLILEPLPGKLTLMAFSARLNQIEQEYYTHRNVEAAIQACQSLVREAHSKSETACEALGLAHLAGYYQVKGAITQNTTWQSLAAREYTQAMSLAKQSGNKDVTGKVLAKWAGYYLTNAKGPTDAIAGRSLLQQAVKITPLEPLAYAWLGTLLLNANQDEMAGKTLDQALMLEPNNRLALLAQYTLYGRKNDKQMQERVLAQLKKYYPTAQLPGHPASGASKTKAQHNRH